jgi:hypothetical protein
MTRMKPLKPKTRKEVAHIAATARWTRRLTNFNVVPKDDEELLNFIAYCTKEHSDLGGEILSDILLGGISLSRRNSAALRMLPVFIWRMRTRFDERHFLNKGAGQSNLHNPLGHALKLTTILGGDFDLFKETISHLSNTKPLHESWNYFHDSGANPFEMMVLEERTPPETKEWRLLTGMPMDSYETHFAKATRRQP